MGFEKPTWEYVSGGNLLTSVELHTDSRSAYRSRVCAPTAPIRQPPSSDSRRRLIGCMSAELFEARWGGGEGFCWCWRRFANGRETWWDDLFDWSTLISLSLQAMKHLLGSVRRKIWVGFAGTWNVARRRTGGREVR